MFIGPLVITAVYMCFAICFMRYPFSKKINQLINQSVNQTINQSTNKVSDSISRIRIFNSQCCQSLNLKNSGVRKFFFAPMELGDIPSHIVSGNSKTNHSPGHLSPLQLPRSRTFDANRSPCLWSFNYWQILSVVTCEKDFTLHIPICSSFIDIDQLNRPPFWKQKRNLFPVLRHSLENQPRSGLRHSHQASQLRFGAQPFTVSEKNYVHYHVKTKEKFQRGKKERISKPLAKVFFSLNFKRSWTGYNPVSAYNNNIFYLLMIKTRNVNGPFQITQKNIC